MKVQIFGCYFFVLEFVKGITIRNTKFSVVTFSWIVEKIEEKKRKENFESQGLHCLNFEKNGKKKPTSAESNSQSSVVEWK